MESSCAGRTVAQYNSAFQWREENQAVAALHLMRMFEPSLKFQRL